MTTFKKTPVQKCTGGFFLVESGEWKVEKGF
jgi:hypothetical protein